MGSACCVAARDKTVPQRAGGEALRRNAIDSTSWSFRWDNRGHVAGKIENPSCQVSHGISRNVSMELKGSLGSERGDLSDGGSLMENFGTPTSLKSPVHEGVDVNLMTSRSDLSTASNFSTEVKNLTESPGIADSAAPNHSIFPMLSALSAPSGDTLPTHTYPLLPNSNPSRQARRSPGYQLLRQVSDSRILRLKSPNNNSISEGRPSFVLSNDLASGSQCGSSDGWSIRTFSELVASSQRERWSFDSEYFGSGRGKISGSSSRFSYSPSVELHYCGACSKLLTERSSWNIQKLLISNDVPVSSVLVCGHAYHAECLEIMTAEADRYDPLCPVCTVGEKEVSKISKRALRIEAESKAKNHKISKNRVVDSYFDGDFDVFDHQKDAEHKGKVPKMESSSSTRSSFAKPFLRRHFSIGSKWSRSLSENDSTRKKGFWARYRKD